MPNDANTIIIGKQKYHFDEVELHHSDLKFYPENPRIYSLLVIDGVIPEQGEIEESLKNMDHVRVLRQVIEANGGLSEPLIVRGGDNVVLEGNSRLAAYRMLAKKDPIKWSLVRCRVLPAEISDDAIFTLLGQYHIVRRKDWSKFEQAGYLWRRINNNNIDSDVLAKEMGLSIQKIRQMVAVYDFMRLYDAIDPQKWSYFEEYLKSRSILKARLEVPKLDETIVTQIKNNDIFQAIDIRHKLEPITKIRSDKKRKKVLLKLVNGNSSLDECFEEAEATGVNSSYLKSLTQIRSKLNALDEQIDLSVLSDDDVKRCQFEMKKIISRVKTLEKAFFFDTNDH